MMNIGMVLTKSKFPGDYRVEKEAISLVEAGHRVFVVCDEQEGKPAQEEYKGISVLRLVSPPMLLRKLNSFFYLLFLFNIAWFRFLEKWHRRFNFDALHVHDLPLSGTALHIGKKYHLPVILDLHENYPFALQSFGDLSPSFGERIWKALFHDRLRWERYERRVSRKADRIIVVVKEMGQRIAALGVPNDRIVIVGNTVETTTFDSIPLDKHLIAQYRDRFVISYIGSLDKYRRIDTIIRAMPYVLASIPNALFLIVGETERRPEYKALAKELQLEKAVEFEGWQSFAKVPTYLALSDVGVIPEEKNEQNDNSFPNKLGQYMYASKPVIVSDCISLRRLVTETEAGLVCEADLDNAQAWAEAIVALQDPVIRRQMGCKGRQAVIDTYNWELDSKQLVDTYESLIPLAGNFKK
jgi:glycosyltransferase involved in cell wall biosynthesis